MPPTQALTPANRTRRRRPDSCFLLPLRPVSRFLLVVLMIGVSGCGDGRPARVAVSGKVLIDGEPLTLGNIKFVPTGARPSAGKIDENGNFTLTCYDGNDGAVPGEHRVQVAANRVLSDFEIHWYAPKKYSSFRTSGITAQVSESTDSMVIELTWDGKKPKGGKFYADKARSR